MIYHIYANRSNIGDWLSAKGIQKLLGDVTITECLCDEPFIEETMQILSKATDHDLIVIGGGGLLMDYFNPFWQAFSTVAERVPFCIWGIGYCDIKHEPSLPSGQLVQQIIQKARLCIVRDELSRSHLSACKLPTSIACPSLNYVEEVIESGSDLLHVVNYSTATPETYDAMCGITKTYSETKGITYRETNNLITKGSERELADILKRYQQSAIIVSSALHGCIIGVAMGLKVIAVSGDWKIDAFMGAVGLRDWVISYDETQKLPALLEDIYDQPKPVDYLNQIKGANEEIAKTVRSMHLS